MRLSLLSLLLWLCVGAAWAVDEETARLEAAALCRAQPYNCTKETPLKESTPMPPIAKAVPKRKIPTKKPTAPHATPPPTQATVPTYKDPYTPLSPSPSPPVSTALPPPRSVTDAIAYGCADRAGMTAGSNVTPTQVRAMTACVDRYLGR